MRITIQTDDGEKQIIATDDNELAEALRAHGFSPETTEYSVTKSVEERLSELE